jgi:hypothetical protein
MTPCYPCVYGIDHPWHDDGTEANLVPYQTGGANAPPTHADTERKS